MDLKNDSKTEKEAEKAVGIFQNVLAIFEGTMKYMGEDNRLIVKEYRDYQTEVKPLLKNAGIPTWYNDRLFDRLVEEKPKKPYGSCPSC